MNIQVKAICANEKCKKPIESDGFCSWHGPLNDQLLCDECVAWVRAGRGNLPSSHDKSFVDHAQIALQIEHVTLAIRNMGSISHIMGSDAGGANRDLMITLDWRESKSVYLAIAKALQTRLDSNLDNKLVAEGPPKD